MQNNVKHQVSVPTVPVSRGELVVLAPPAPTLADLTDAIRAAHADVEAALVTAVARALDVGRALLAAKKAVGHRNFTDYVAIECRFTMRSAQNYMRLAKYEREIAQLVNSKNASGAFLRMNEALRLVESLGRRRKRKPPA